MNPRAAMPTSPLPEPSAKIAVAGTGIGLRAPHYGEFLETQPRVGFVEVHSENFFGRNGAERGGQAAQILQRVRRDHALSLHGVGLSLGSAEPVSTSHLAQLQKLVARCEPQWVSEHLSWSGIGGIYVNDLLPLPYTEESLTVIADNVQRVQDVLKRPLLIENPSRYLVFTHDTMSEPEFIRALIQRTGCQLLLDINNVYVSATNLGLDAHDYLRAIDAAAVAEIHLAGYEAVDGLLIDTHSRPVHPPVWDLYREFLAWHGDRPTLIEWDTEIPALAVLLVEADTANRYRAEIAAGVMGEHIHVGIG